MTLVPVRLPNGKEVLRSNTSEPWCLIDGGTGYVDPRMLLPDPEQPRRHMVESELSELKESVTEVGVREPITVTPLSRVPWMNVVPQYKEQFFLIVSGHRRTSTSLDAGAPAVPIRVVIYASKAEHYLDRSILNKGRSELTPLEEGYEILLLREANVPLQQIAKSFGCVVPSLYNKINLTKLEPAIQELLNPKLAEKSRLPAGVGYALGGVTAPSVDEILGFLENYPEVDTGISVDSMSDDERRFHLQHALLKVIQNRSLNSARAIELIKNLALSLKSVSSGAQKRTKRYQPQKRKDIFENWLRGTESSVIIDWSPAEWERVFQYMPPDELDALATRINNTRGLLEQIARKFTRMADRKRPRRA